MGEAKSRLRQRILDLEAERQREIERVVAERGPLIRGSVGERRRVCGYAGCKCARGELHASKYLAATVQGTTRQIHVPESEVMRVSESARRYQGFRRARTRLGRLAAEEASLVDRLGDALLESYPPEDPLPPASRRGPRPKKRRHEQR